MPSMDSALKVIRAWGQLGLQDGRNPLTFYLSSFHDFSIVVITLVTIYASISVFTALTKYSPINKGLQTNHVLEFIWTILPIVVLITVAIPSLALLFILEDTSKESVPVKVIGRQWYWTYEQAKAEKAVIPYSFSTKVRECYMLPKESDYIYIYRLLDTTEKLELNSSINYTFIITSSDVLHSWAIPSLGIKIDACPGRLNYSFVAFATIQTGEYFGQCSEICGRNHRFIPIRISVKWDQLKASTDIVYTNPKIYPHISEYYIAINNAGTAQITNFVRYIIEKCFKNNL